MAIRTIRTEGDPVLTKKCREVTQMTPRLRELIEDMYETMYEANGVGLAAPQVGILKQIVVIDIGDEEFIGDEETAAAEDMSASGEGAAAPAAEDSENVTYGPITLINPVIIAQDGEQTGDEGCLSVPGMAGQVTRPDHVIVRALDEDMNEVEIEGRGLMARAICHEVDHLSGIMYTSKVEGSLHEVSYENEE